MQILAASAEKVGDFFLHAGYMSAYPRTFVRHFEGTSAMNLPEVAVKLDIGEALRLQGDALNAADRVYNASVNAVGHSGLLILGTACFFLSIAVAYGLRQHRHPRAATVCLLFAVVALTAVALYMGQGITAGGVPKPSGKPVAKQTYADPQKATEALLHGVIADAAINYRGRLGNLAQLQPEIALPVKKLTRGEEYALATYTLDGWGRELQLSKTGNKARPIRVASAGADGVFSTPDDISISIRQATDDDWEQSRSYYIRKSAGMHVVLVHRWPGKMFQYGNASLARELTGSTLFDALLVEDPAAMKTMLEQIPGIEGDDPLVLIAFGNRG